MDQVKTSYEQKIAALQARFIAVDKLKGEMPDDLLEVAKAALLQGDETQADDLFRRVEEQGERTAEAVYQRGLIARDNINYRTPSRSSHVSMTPWLSRRYFLI